MKRSTFLLAAGLLCGAMVIIGCAGIDIRDQDTKDFLIESIAIELGYEMRDVELGNEVDYFYGQLAIGVVSLKLSQQAQGYLSKHMHPVLASRLIKLSALLGYDLDEAGRIVGVQNLDMRLLRIAAEGFRTGYNLK